jgi:chromate transporter
MGAIGFGGGLSVLSNIHTHAVDKRRWLTDPEFVSIAAVAQMLPGGASANAMAQLGLRFYGMRGALFAYLAFVAPGVLSILALSWIYVRFGTVPKADAFLSGLNAAVTGVVISITLRMLSTGVARLWQMGVAAVALLLSLVGNATSAEVVLMGIGAGLAWDLLLPRARAFRLRFRWSPPAPITLPEEGRPLSNPAPVRGAAPSPTAAPPPGPVPGSGSGGPLAGLFFHPLMIAAVSMPQVLLDLFPLALVFFRLGLGAYGGGFAIIPSLHSEMITRGWVTERQFADAVAVGKLTPGPVLLMGTFIGYLRDGPLGAMVATVAILAGPFCLTVLLATWLERGRNQRWMRAGLRGLTPAVVGLMAAAAVTLGTSLNTGAGVGIAAAVALTLIRFESINPVVMLAVGGFTRVAIQWLTGS